MGFFQKLRRQTGSVSDEFKKPTHTHAIPEAAPAVSDNSTVSSKRSIEEKKKIKKKNRNIKIAQGMLEQMNHYETPEAFLACYTSNEAMWNPEDFPGFTAETCALIIDNLHKSFPDIVWEYKEIREFKPDVVLVEGLRCSGTHTGAPYSVLPGLPAVSARGKYVCNDEENLYLTIVNNKISMVEIIAFGCITGPAGFYQQIGGDLSNLAPPKKA